MAPEAGPKGQEATGTKESSFSASDTLGKMWDAFTQKESTETQKKAMKTILEKQKQELAEVVNKYKEGRSVIVGESGQDKTTLLKEIKQTLQSLKATGNEMGGIDEQSGVLEDSYEKLEAKITGTKETVNFKNPEFMAQAIDNLTQFEASLNAAPTRTQAEVDILNQADAMKEKQPPVAAETPTGRTTEKAEEPVAPVTPAKVEAKNSEYTIKKGDTLSKIAKEHSTTVADLAKLNNITDKKLTIYAGKTLKIPATQGKDNAPSAATNYPPNTKGVQGLDAVPGIKDVQGPDVVPNTKVMQGPKK